VTSVRFDVGMCTIGLYGGADLTEKKEAAVMRPVNKQGIAAIVELRSNSLL